jgi:hypothetical protein
MDTTILVAKVIGIYLVLSGLLLITKKKTFSLILQDYFGHPAIMYLTGVILVFLSASYLLQYNIWDGTMRTLVTFVMWLLLIKGVLIIFVPKAFSKMNMDKWRGIFGFYGALAVIAGVYLFFW